MRNINKFLKYIMRNTKQRKKIASKLEIYYAKNEIANPN